MLTTENRKWFKVVGIKISFEHVDSWAKSLLFRTHHLWNSTTELMLYYRYAQSLLLLQVSSYDFEPTFIICFVIRRVPPDQPKWKQITKPLTRNKHLSLLYFCIRLRTKPRQLWELFHHVKGIKNWKNGVLAALKLFTFWCL